MRRQGQGRESPHLAGGGRKEDPQRVIGGGIGETETDIAVKEILSRGIAGDKSQGSEFNRVLLVLPGQRSPLLTRELLYTAVSRARQSLKIFGVAEVFVAASKERIQRTSGLREQLWALLE